MISAVVPSYRGRARLERNLGSVAAALEASGERWEILVVDDGGGLREAPAPARLVSLPENSGYGPAVNAGAAAAGGDLLLILNDDLRLEVGTLRKLRPHLAPDVFAVVPRIRSPLARCGDEGGKAAAFRAGLLEILEAPSDATHATLYAVGCCYLCPRSLYLELGGYDDLYAPFLWEDVDLGYRAWRRGLRVLHVPEAACDHEGSATLSEQRTLEERERIGFRNRVLFHLRNLRDTGRREAAFGALAATALFEPSAGRRAGLADALARFAGSGRRSDAGLGDAEILARAGAR